MKPSFFRYSLPVMLILAGVVLLLITGMESMTFGELTQVRRDQLREIRLDSNQKIEALRMFGDKAVKDYFLVTDAGYQYMGGIYEGSWRVGETYNTMDLESTKPSAMTSHEFFNTGIGENSFYINVDRGDESAVKDFLKAIDQHGLDDLDTLVIDFRFLGNVDFGSVLRLFNQIAPRDRMVLGTSISDHQETVVRSSGQPFFAADHTLLLIDPVMPQAVKRLVLNLNEYPGYEALGSSGYVADTVCLYTEFKIGPDVYRMCTEKWTDGAKDTSPDETLFLNDTVEIHLMQLVDEYWYKSRDTAAMKNLIPGMIRRLSP